MKTRSYQVLAMVLLAGTLAACGSPSVAPAASLPDPKLVPAVTVYREPT